MDKVIERQRRPVWQWIAMTAGALVLGTLAWNFAARAGSSRLNADATRLTTGVVRTADFLEYYPFDARVEPKTSVYLDIEEGGRVDQIFVEGGQQVNAGDLILRFSNASLQRTAIDTESQLLYNLDILRNTQFNRSQGALLLKESLLELDHQILELEKKYARYEPLMKTSVSPISMADFETMRDQLQHLRNRRTLLAQRVAQEDAMAQRQLDGARNSIERLNASMELLGRIVQSLEVRAPISGHLSAIDAQIGQSIARGQRIGQIDQLDGFKLRASIDQFYIGRVQAGTAGRVTVDGKSWPVVVEKVYSEVKNNAFQADVEFADGAPPGLRRGQTLAVELTFGEPTRALLAPRGSYQQQTSGRWVYLIDADGSTARRTPVRMGRQNPRDVEILEGLREGDRIITSSYEIFNGVDELRFDTPILIKDRT